MISLAMRGLNTNIPLHTPLNKMVWPKGRTGLLLRWLGPCWQSLNLHTTFGPKPSPPLAMLQTDSTSARKSTRLHMILNGNKPNISYFRVFGCKCFYLIKGVRLSKFESKALEGIFV